MLHLLYALALLLLLCGACAILAERFTLSPALLPLPVLSGAVVVLYLCGVAGFLRVGAVAVLLALAAVWVVGLVQYRPAGVAAAWKRAASAPGFTLFLGGAAFIWLLFCVQQPMFTQWDEFTAWGLAPKMVVERGAFYVADPVNLKASFTYPATSLNTFLFQPFGPWAEWACLAAIDTLALACLAAASALPRERWAGGVLVFAAGFLLPFFFSATPTGSYAAQYVNAMADLPLAMLFGGTLCLYFAVGRRKIAYWLVALPLAVLTLTKDICFAYGLIAAFLIGLDLWLAADEPCRKAFPKALLRAGALAVIVLAAFSSWGRYTAAVTPTADTAASVGSEGLSYGAVLVGGVKQLLGMGRTEKFAQIMAAMSSAFFTRRICLLGGGIMAVAAITMVAAAAWLAADRGAPRRRVLAAHLGFAFCFAALYLFHLILYNYNFSDLEGLALKDYDRYLAPYYQAWMLAMLCLLARCARGGLLVRCRQPVHAARRRAEPRRHDEHRAGLAGPRAGHQPGRRRHAMVLLSVRADRAGRERLWRLLWPPGRDAGPLGQRFYESGRERKLDALRLQGRLRAGHAGRLHGREGLRLYPDRPRGRLSAAGVQPPV